MPQQNHSPVAGATHVSVPSLARPTGNPIAMALALGLDGAMGGKPTIIATLADLADGAVLALDIVAVCRAPVSWPRPLTPHYTD